LTTIFVQYYKVFTLTSKYETMADATGNEAEVKNDDLVKPGTSGAASKSDM
jgi:hypothetical protein